MQILQRLLSVDDSVPACASDGMWGFLKIIGIAVAVLVAGGGLWLGSLIWRSPDYAAAGTCSVGEIQRTRAAIDDMHIRHEAAQMRVRHENDLRRRTLATTAKGNFSGLVFKAWDRENSAAFYCNHAYIRPAGQRPFLTLPPAVAWLKPHVRDEDEAWRLATCISYSGYAPAFPEGYTTDIPALRKLCDIRKAARVKRGE